MKFLNLCDCHRYFGFEECVAVLYRKVGSSSGLRPVYPHWTGAVYIRYESVLRITREAIRKVLFFLRRPQRRRLLKIIATKIPYQTKPVLKPSCLYQFSALATAVILVVPLWTSGVARWRDTKPIKTTSAEPNREHEGGAHLNRSDCLQIHGSAFSSAKI